KASVLKLRAKAVVSLMALVIAFAAAPRALADEASNLYKKGRKAERAGQMAEAYLLYSRAAALAPKKKTYWLRSQAVRTRAAAQSKFEVPADADSAATDSTENADAPDMLERI